MDRDPYQILGVGRDVAGDELRRAYRRLAKTLHPDLNPADTDAEAKFKRLSSAYELLSDPQKRERYDRGEIDADGDEEPPRQYPETYAASVGDPYDAAPDGFSDFVDHDDLLSEIFSRGERGAFSTRGQDAFYRFDVDFLDIVNGATRQLSLPDGTALEVTIPPGMREGQILRLRGRGKAGLGGGPPGDALVEIEPLPHPIFSRRGDDIHLEFPISLGEAVLGAKVVVPTPTGPVTMALPHGANTGTVVRLRGKGVRRSDGSQGDEYLTLKVMLPAEPDAELEAFLASWGGNGYDPRRTLERTPTDPEAAQTP